MYVRIVKSIYLWKEEPPRGSVAEICELEMRARKFR